jgi:hypothetical protein
MRTRYISNNLHLESSTAFYGPAVNHTGFIEGLVFAALLASGSALAGSALAIGLITGIVSIGRSLGLSYLASSMFRPPQPKPEDVQQSTKQPTQPRTRHYGRVKVSGPWVFAEATSSNFHKVLALGVGPIDAFEEVWIEDAKVTLNGSGWVTNGVWGDGNNNARILLRRGLATETHYAELRSAFSVWTTAHRGDGIASLYAFQAFATQENYMKRWPNGINTSYRVVMRAAQVMNPTTGVVAWSDNAAAIIRDYITHRDGMRLPESIVTTPLAQAGWAEAYNRAQEAVALKGGGSEQRYRLWGSYRLDERPADVLGRMLPCSDARLVPTPDGGLTLDIGKWQAPTVILGPDAITGFSELGRGRDILSTANTIRATFVDPAGDYQAADADPWVNAEDVSARGEIASDLQFNMAPSHTQCRRLMKLAAYRANPKWVATFQLNLMGLAAFGERFVRIQYPLFQINEVFEIQDFKFVIGEGGILIGATIQVQSMPQSAYQWDPAQEEGNAPVADDSEGSGLPTPAAPLVDIIAGPKARLSFSPSPNSIYAYQAQYKKTADTDWTLIADIPQAATSVDTGLLVAGTQYQFQLRLITTGVGFTGDWGPTATATTL